MGKNDNCFEMVPRENELRKILLFAGIVFITHSARFYLRVEACSAEKFEMFTA